MAGLTIKNLYKRYDNDGKKKKKVQKRIHLLLTTLAFQLNRANSLLSLDHLVVEKQQHFV
jgi:hypothetical protein